MQKKNSFFFAFPSESTLGRQVKGTIKRAKCKRKTRFSLHFRVKVPWIDRSEVRLSEREYLGYILHFRKDSGVEVVQPC